MKTLRSNFCLTGYRDPDYVLFRVILIVVCANLVMSEVSEGLQEKITNNKKNVGSIAEVQESKINGGQSTESVHQRSRKITNRSDSPALRSFLKNILKARDELKWIDRAASRINYRNGPYGTVYPREIMDERGSSSDDRLNSNKNLRYEWDNGENRWTRDYGVPRTNNEDSEIFKYMQGKRELTDTAVSLETLRKTLLELRANLTGINDDSRKDKLITKNNENRKFTEDDLISEKNNVKNEHKKDTMFSRLNNQKHTERSSTLSNGDENTSLVWWNEPKPGEEISNFRKTLNDAEIQDEGMILSRKKRIDIKNDLKNEENTDKNISNLKESSLPEKTPDINDYWHVNNYKEVSNVDDLMAMQGKLLDYNNDRNFGKETHQIVKFKSPERRLLSIVESESEEALTYNESKCLIQNNLFSKRKLLQNEDENFEEDSLAIDEITSKTSTLDNEQSAIKQVEEWDNKSDNSENILQEFDEVDKLEKKFIDNPKASEVKRRVKVTLGQAKDPYEARIDMLIKQRIASRHRDDKNHLRRKRYPLGIIEYYDYDEEFENNVENNRAKKDYSNKNMEFDKNSTNSRNCTLLNKKNEQAEEQEKEERKKGKTGNKEPKQEFIVDEEARAKNETDKSRNPDKSPKGKVTFKENDKRAEIDRQKSFLKENEKSLEPSDTKWSDRNQVKNENGRRIEEHILENTNPEIILPKESLEYIFRAPETIEQEIVDVIFNDVQPIDASEYNKKADNFKKFKPENQLAPNKLDNKEDEDVDTVYEELKQIYDWEDNDNKNRLRLKGDQRLYQESENNFEKETNTTSGTNYMALKKTDDLFKGGIEQSDTVDVKSSPNSTTSSKSQADSMGSDWKVTGTINDSRPKSNEVPRSMESERRTKLEADSGSPYENGKYLESLKRERNDNERLAIESNDMHESFVEPLDEVDDSDNVRVRFGRSLKTIDDSFKTTQSTKINSVKNKIDFIENISLNETHDNISTKSIAIINNVKDIAKCEDESNRTINVNLSNLLGSDNRNETIRKNQIPEKETRSSVNKINKIGSMGHSTLPSASNKNASRVKREENSYSLTHEEGSPFELYDRRSNEIVNDFYTINPYEYSLNQDSWDYFDPNLTDQLNPIDFEANGYKERKKNSLRHKFKKGKRKKKRRKKKRKKNTNSRKLKKRTKNLNELNRRFVRKNRRKRKPRYNFHDFSNSFSKKGKKRKSTKALKDRERRKIKSNRGSSNQKMLSDANMVPDMDQSRMKRYEAGTRKKKLALLLTADNMEDESQMDMALHGELPGKIVENIFEQVQKNEALKVALGPGLYRKNKPGNANDERNRQNVDDDKVRHTEKLMEKIMELLDRLVLDEVQRRICVTLPTEMRQFLEWIVEVNGDEESREQAPLLPLVHDQETIDHSGDDKILFPKGYDQENDDEVNELQKKIRILKNLINEYNALSAKEKIKVQTVHDYLVRQLNLLLHYIETKEKAEKEKTSRSSLNVGAARRKIGSIIRYDSAVPKSESHTTINGTLSKLNNSTTELDKKNKKRRLIRSSNKFWNYRDRKRKKRKRRKGKRKNRGKRYNTNETPEYRKLVHRAAIMRKKRADILEDEWNPFDFRYEEPEIYKSMSILSDGNGNRRDARSTRVMQKREILESNNVTVANLVSNNIDLLPVKGKNLAEDEMILLNKREAWKKENERQLEEVAFGTDMRNKLAEEEQFKKLTEINKNGIVDEKSREKRENAIEKVKVNSINDCSNNSINDSTTLQIPKNEHSHDFVNVDTVLTKNSEMKNNTYEITHLVLSNEDKLKLLEQKINVYTDRKNDTSN